MLALLQRFLSGGSVSQPLFVVLFVGPLGYVFAALCRRPAEPTQQAPASPGWSLLLYAPYAIVGAALAGAQVHHRDGLAGPTVAFFALTALLLARQFVLLEELREAYETLEVRVRERTRDLESMQSTVMRTERMNLAATLGAGLAHDLNNALTVIRANATVVEELAAGKPEAEPAADLSAAAQRAAALTGRLMRFARQARDDGPAVIDVRECAAALEGLLRAFVGRGIELTMDLEPARALVASSRSRFEQILVNLVTNARDAVDDDEDEGEHDGKRERRAIAVRVRRVRDAPRSEHVELRVEDNGRGMPDDVRAHLFEPFFTTKDEGRGTGLGLVSVRAMVEQDGGSVSVDSAPGRGTSFRVTWPAPAPATVTELRRAAGREGPRAAGRPFGPPPPRSR